MNVKLHIERLVIDGLPIGSSDGSDIEAALAAELRTLIGEGGLDRLGESGWRPLVRTAPIARAATDGAGLGTQIGQAVYGAVGR